VKVERRAAIYETWAYHSSSTTHTRDRRSTCKGVAQHLRAFRNMTQSRDFGHLCRWLQVALQRPVFRALGM
jgi:hypothetical protein